MKSSLVSSRVMPFSAARLWPVMSDTAFLNRKLGLSVMNFTTVEGVRHGKQKVAGFTLKWTEAPWEWKYESWLKNERVYQRGFFHSIKGHFELRPLGDESTEVILRFALEHRWKWVAGLLDKATLSVQKKLLDEIERSTRERQTAGPVEMVARKSLAQWLAEASAQLRLRIMPKPCARETGAQWEEVLEEGLAFEGGRLALRFNAVCPHCRGTKKSVGRLTEMVQPERCDSCAIDFNLGPQESIEISLKDLSVPPSEVGVDFCSADVVHKPTVVYQRLGGAWIDSLTLSPGSYLLKKKGEINPVPLSVEMQAGREFLELDTLWNRRDFSPLRVHPELGLRSQRLAADALVMLERLDDSRGALLLGEVLANPRFSHLIPPQNVVSTFPLEMGNRALLFTDVVGSTEMYYRVGDTEAFRLVRESFVLIGEITARHQGVLVKTIGDATLYAFADCTSALKASIDLMIANRDNPVQLRASLHHGPCLMVGSDDGPDFFGDTVNVCAKFQSEAEAGQVTFSRELREKLSGEFWQQWQGKAETLTFKMKGASQRQFELYRLSF